MFDFLRKKDLWDALDAGYLEDIKANKISYQLKIAQDLAIYDMLKGVEKKIVGEIGGGDSRILGKLSGNNKCYNIDKFEGCANGPVSEVNIEDVENINAFIGNSHNVIEGDFFDVIFSISVVEHVLTEDLDSFFEDSIRILKPGGMFIHAIDMYLEENPPHSVRCRYEEYKNWLVNRKNIFPVNEIFNGDLAFTTDMVSNPDNIMYSWGAIAPNMTKYRKTSQNVSVIVAGYKAVEEGGHE